MIAVLKILDDPHAWKGWGMLFGMVFVVWPLIIFWCTHPHPHPPPAAAASSPTIPTTTRCVTAMDFNLRKNDGHGSAYIFELFEGCECCSRMGVADGRFWKRHLGNDALFTMWFLSIGASAMWLGVLGSLVLDPTDTQMRFLMVDGTILLAAMWLMLGAAYPENFNKSTFFGEYSDEQEAPGTPRGQMRRDSNSRIFAPAGSPRVSAPVPFDGYAPRLELPPPLLSDSV